MSSDPEAPTLEGDGGTATQREELRDLLGMRPRRSESRLRPGETIGESCRIERELGAGGMGVVYLARDVRLDREVAIKVHGTVTPDSAERLEREATALARLVHPHVVTVHQVGSHRGHPFVVMEYVPGGTARTWLAAAPRRPDEIVALYLAAARGLAAAHAAGLVHRDFKPDNVLVGDDGRIRVADFGLAEDVRTAETRTGEVAGTPAYMAPEQRNGAAVGPAADQYALATSLREALGDRAERRVARALERARADDPAARFPSIDALIAALTPPRPRAVWIAAATAGVVAVGGIVAAVIIAGGRDHAAAPPPPPCAAAPHGLDDVWPPPRRAAVAGAAGEPIAARLDTYAAAWTTERIEACEATNVRHERSGDELDRRNRCLDSQRTRLDAVIDAVGAGPSGRALDAVLDLDEPARCADAIARPPRSAAALAIEHDVAQARALYVVGRYRDGLPIARDAAAAAIALDDAGLVADAQLWLGWLEMVSGDAARGRAALEEGIRRAATAQDDVLTAQLWVALLMQQVGPRDDPDEGERLLVFTEAALVRAGSPPRLEVALASVRGSLRQQQGRLPEARASFERAIELVEALDGPDDPRLGVPLDGLGTVLSAMGELDEARRAHDRALRLIEGAYGVDSMRAAPVLNNLAIVEQYAGRYDEAIALLERVLVIKERELGAEHPELISTLANLAILRFEVERLDLSLPLLDRALTVAIRAYGDDHPMVARLRETRAQITAPAADPPSP